MRILGISELDNDSGAALFVDGALVGAVSEERFTRVKRQAGFPQQSVAWLLARGGFEARDLDRVVIAKAARRDEARLVADALRAKDWWGSSAPFLRQAVNWLAFFGYRATRHRLDNRRYQTAIDSWLAAAGVSPERVLRAGHHRSHAASAWFASGFARGLVVTLDGQGGGVSASVWRGDGSSLELVREVRTPDSLGFFYALVTRALGFTPARHEGKVTGLAALAAPGPRALALMREMAFASGDGFETPGLYGAYPALRRLIREEGQAAVASAAQRVLEEVATQFVARHLEATGERCVALAGGVAGNVKLNQRIAETPGVEEVFVFPHMGDGGLAYGAVVDLLASERGRKPEAISDALWGPEFDDAACERALSEAGVSYTRPADLARAAAELLASGATIGRCSGRLEFGPRALGNRSILYQATDATVNDWLNRALRRVEFMPFAPATLSDAAAQGYLGWQRARHASEFMTVTFACSATLAEAAPAVVHVDGTARPQVVRREANPAYHDLIAAYRQRTGLSSIINTSFNMHEEPIVLSPSDAVRAAAQAGLDALIVGPFLAVREPHLRAPRGAGRRA